MTNRPLQTVRALDIGLRYLRVAPVCDEILNAETTAGNQARLTRFSFGALAGTTEERRREVIQGYGGALNGRLGGTR